MTQIKLNAAARIAEVKAVSDPKKAREFFKQRGLKAPGKSRSKEERQSGHRGTPNQKRQNNR